MRKALILGVLTCTAVFSFGCTAVKPWEKGNLARPEMAIDTDPLESRFNRHVEESREGSRGGYGVAGGGCGCG